MTQNLLCSKQEITRRIPSSAQTSISWSGYQWFLKDQPSWGPGPNEWSSSNVWIDQNNRLHLKLRQSGPNGRCTCAELYTQTKFGYGTYRWYVEGTIDRFDPNVVVGLFTYGGVDGINEIDIEVAKWGQTSSNASNLFYTVYPSSLGGQSSTSSSTLMSLEGTYTSHQFTWSTYQVDFKSQHGHFIDPNYNVFSSYQTPSSFNCLIPQDTAPLHMNLWLFQGQAPIDGQEVEVIIHNFQYTPICPI
ncbi:unnamed protein product [Didymodactylos carnosus]|uniref:GH16 domain-containing protein n=1 Tax=Didymodactylos carnosus TaxID=1234261 RepID=A0A815TRY6_9BILA|nr:unnamed protein product [Didymodactylos carnosus]CAF1509788.1 unnamed protein product [Didymodactylos carnosus]CAF4236930.1 unnamed protein product [Didymodactylos carnosus]CAF4370625.1 unnamed protein product [Didymodactylos carnosus]